MQCDDLADVVAGMHDHSAVADEPARAHIDTCLRCQAELVQYRRLARTMHSLKDLQARPGAGLDEEILHVLDDPELLRSNARTSRRAAYLSGLAAATAAGAAGAIVIASRARSRRLAG